MDKIKIIGGNQLNGKIYISGAKNAAVAIIPAAILCGTTIMLACDIISQVAATQGILPINSITALFGSPIIIWIIMKGYR